ncbi:MAG: hypothetical protein KJ915_11415 [Candidatus Omnitrophica bacterium]|nr:hypothetical protein [Candidatus Omnitrophota bacterium]
MKIKKTVTYLLFFLLIFCYRLSFAEQGWTQLNSDHFIVYYQDSDKNFAADVARKAEEYYNSIADNLGYVRYSNFWKWDKRVKIYIYPDHASYLLATNQQSWSHGVADYFKKEIISYAWGKDFLKSLLPHELAHLIFRDFVGFKSDIPLWLDEGVAQWEETELKAQRLSLVRQQASQNIILPIRTMIDLDIRTIETDQQIKLEGMALDNGQIPILEMDGRALVNIYYLQAFSLVGFLMERYGAESFVVFSRQLRDGKTISDALKFAYPQQLRSIEQLEKQWKQYLLNA